MPPVIRLDRLTKRFGAEIALDQVSLEVPPGVVFALLGENGAGKTTAIRIMLGLAQPNSGHAQVLGLNSRKQGLNIRQRVGYVAERPTMYEWMTVEEIGWFTAGFYGPGFLPEYAKLVAQFGLPPKKKLKTLSKGTRAKVSLSLALAHQPELLVLDEPTSGLDAMVRREFLESMVDRASQGQTVFLSSHQITEVERVADIVAILRHGRLLLVERLDELKASVRRLIVTLKDGAKATPALGGHVLSQRWQPRQGEAIVRGLSDGQLAMLQANDDVAGVEVHPTSLEDIFIAYMQGNGSCPNSCLSNNGTVPFGNTSQNLLQEASRP
jgi:ABC-2 type transport system ATP-binding protein